MQSSQTPKLMPLAFAATGGRNSIPEASQLPTVPNGASYADGFPPATRTAIVAGGKPPAGLDMNGILYEITQSLRWGHAGGAYTWNSAFTTDTNVGGYPNGACLMRADLTGFWLNTADNNQTNPDATDGSAANWVPGYNYGVTPITGLTNANVTLTPAQAAKNKITLAGSLTGNIQLIFPTWTKEWTVVNNTTGAFTITAKTAAGTGIALAAGQQKIIGDGTNITQPAESIAAATLTTQPMQLGQATGRLIGIQRFTSSGTYTPSSSLVTRVVAKLQGAGGGSGGALGTASNTVSAGGPGSEGAYVEALFTSGFSGAAVTVGAAGAAGAAGGAGGNGGASTFLTASAGGGYGGGISGTSTLSVVAGPAGNAAASGGFKNLNGNGSGYSQAVAIGSGGFALPGMGGGGTTPTNAAVKYGCGGGGTANGFSAPASVGYAGYQGYVEIWEYA
jgi:hypothetical protein